MLYWFTQLYLRSNIVSRVASYLSIAAASRLENVFFLNFSMDGVSCEVQKNLGLTVSYLHKYNNQVSMPDPNHDNKNHPYQLIGGPGCAGASVGFYTFNPLFVTKATSVSADVVPVLDMCLTWVW